MFLFLLLLFVFLPSDSDPGGKLLAELNQKHK